MEAAGESFYWGDGMGGVWGRAGGVGGEICCLVSVVQQATADGKHEARWPLAPALTHLTWRDLS